MSTPSTTRTVAARRPRKVTPIHDIEKQFLLFISAWRAATAAGKARDKASAVIKAWFERGGDSDHEISVNDNGSLGYDFPEPVLLDGVTVTGLEAVRRESSELDLDLLDEYLDKLPEGRRAELTRKLYKRVTDTVFQPDALFALNQSGEITDDDLDSFYTTSTTYALTVKKG